MCAFRIAWRVFLVIVVFFATGLATSHLLITHAVQRGAREYDVRLAGLMGGLFAGGVAAVVVALALFLTGRKPPSERRPDPV